MLEMDKNYEKKNQDFFSALSNNDQIFQTIISLN